MQITHARTDVPADSSNPDEIQPSDFTADHVLVDVASATDLANLRTHVGSGSDIPMPNTVLVDDGTNASQWRDTETWLNSYERRIKTTNARIQSAALLAIPADPLVLIAAPGVGYFVRVVGGLCVYSFGTTPYAVDTFFLRGGDGGVPWAELGSAIGASVNTLMPVDVEHQGDRADPGWTIENAPIVLTANSLTGGDGQLDIWLDYMVLPMPVVD